jgi:hypothetical protein
MWTDFWVSMRQIFAKLAPNNLPVTNDPFAVFGVTSSGAATAATGTETGATIAVRLMKEMLGTHKPNVGMLQPGSPIPAAQVVQIWCNGMPESVWFFDQPAWDKDTTPANRTNLIDPYDIGALLAGMGFLVKTGVAPAAIEAAVAANPKLYLRNLYSNPAEGAMWTDFWVSMRQIFAKLAPNNLPVTNDPFGIFGVTF